MPAHYTLEADDVSPKFRVPLGKEITWIELVLN
jgi:hypothetical protein